MQKYILFLLLFLILILLFLISCKKKEHYQTIDKSCFVGSNGPTYTSSNGKWYGYYLNEILYNKISRMLNSYLLYDDYEKKSIKSQLKEKGFDDTLIENSIKFLDILYNYIQNKNNDPSLDFEIQKLPGIEWSGPLKNLNKSEDGGFSGYNADTLDKCITACGLDKQCNMYLFNGDDTCYLIRNIKIDKTYFDTRIFDNLRKSYDVDIRDKVENNTIRLLGIKETKCRVIPTTTKSFKNKYFFDLNEINNKIKDGCKSTIATQLDPYDYYLRTEFCNYINYTLEENSIIDMKQSNVSTSYFELNTKKSLEEQKQDIIDNCFTWCSNNEVDGMKCKAFSHIIDKKSNKNKCEFYYHTLSDNTISDNVDNNININTYIFNIKDHTTRPPPITTTTTTQKPTTTLPPNPCKDPDFCYSTLFAASGLNEECFKKYKYDYTSYKNDLFCNIPTKCNEERTILDVKNSCSYLCKKIDPDKVSKTTLLDNKNYFNKCDGWKSVYWSNQEDIQQQIKNKLNNLGFGYVSKRCNTCYYNDKSLIEPTSDHIYKHGSSINLNSWKVNNITDCGEICKKYKKCYGFEYYQENNECKLYAVPIKNDKGLNDVDNTLEGF